MSQNIKRKEQKELKSDEEQKLAEKSKH